MLLRKSKPTHRRRLFTVCTGVNIKYSVHRRRFSLKLIPGFPTCLFEGRILNDICRIKINNNNLVINVMI